MHTLRRIGSVVFCLAISFVVSACSSNNQEPAPCIHSVQQAATVHVATLSVDRWENQQQAMQPQFTNSTTSALGLALPRTSIAQNAASAVFSGQLQLGLPQTSQTGSNTQTLTNGITGTGTTGTTQGSSSNTGTSTNNGTTTSSGSTSSSGSTTTSTSTTTNNGASTTQTTTTQLAPGTLPPSLLTSPTMPSASALPFVTGTVQMDPIMTYQAATAIYEEVQLLNTYLTDAALAHDYKPYLVRVQVSVVPFVRNAPYDVYVDLGLFSKCDAKSTDEWPAKVIPLLVTDDVETGQTSNAMNAAQQLALALGGIVHNVAGQTQVQDLRDKFKAILGTDYNSLYEVSRGAENVLQIRLGAARNPNLKQGYAMLTQTHNVSFVLLVPGNKCGGQAPHYIAMTSFTRMRNAKTGAELQADDSLILDQAEKVAKRYQKPGQPSLSFDNLDKLVSKVQKNDLDGFKEAAEECGIKPGYVEAFWTGLTTAISMSEYAGTHFELPNPPKVLVGAGSQTVILQDDCKESATATIAGLGNVTPGNATALLDLGKPGAQEYAYATSITQSAAGGPFTLQFPSLVPFEATGGPLKSNITKVCPPPQAGKANPSPQPVELPLAKLYLLETGDGRWNTPTLAPLATFNDIIYSSSVPADTSLALTAAVDSIVSGAQGNGSLRFLIKMGKNLDDVAISMVGGSIATATLATATGPMPLPPVNGGLVIQKPPGPPTPGGPNQGQLVIDVTLQGLVAGRTVSVSATGEKNTALPGATAKPTPVSSTMIEVPVLPASNNIGTPGELSIVR